MVEHLHSETRRQRQPTDCGEPLALEADGSAIGQMPAKLAIERTPQTQPSPTLPHRFLVLLRLPKETSNHGQRSIRRQDRRRA